jgi:hypothetical protein
MLSVTRNGYEIPFVERHRPGDSVEAGLSGKPEAIARSYPAE